MELSKELIEKARKIVHSKEFMKAVLLKSLNESNEKPKNKELFKFHMDKGINFDEQICREFVHFCLEYLKINDNLSDLTVVLSTDKELFSTFAFYNFEEKLAAVYCIDRNILDCFRSLAHELVHFKQDLNKELTSDQVGLDNDGVEVENEANAIAGIIMRKFGRKHRDLY